MRTVLRIISVLIVALTFVMMESDASMSADLVKDSDIHLPAMYVYSPSSKHIVSFIWSAECVRCRNVFQNQLWDAYLKAHNKQEVSFAFFEYEDDPAVIESGPVDAVCKGKEFYAFWVLGSLVAGIDVPTAATLPQIKGKIKDNCRDRELARKIVTGAFAQLKTKMPNLSHDLPVVILDGKVLEAPFDLSGKL